MEKYDIEIDVSAPSKFLHAPEGVRMIPLSNNSYKPYTVGGVTVAPRSTGMVSSEAYCRKNNIQGHESIVSGTIFGPPPSKMYGWPFDPTEEQPKPPEPSPIDKAIDDMMARRKAKREVVKGQTVCDSGAPDPTYRKEMYDLDRAMQKLTHWEVPFADRLNPYRGPVL